MISSKNNSPPPPTPSSTSLRNIGHNPSLLGRCFSDPYSSPAPPQPNPFAVDRKRKAVSLPQSPERIVAFNPSLRPPLPPAPPQLLSRSNSDLDSTDDNSYSGYASSSDMSRESDDSHVKRLKYSIRKLKALSHGFGLLILDNPYHLYPPHNDVIHDDPSIEDSSEGEFSQFESDSVEKKG